MSKVKDYYIGLEEEKEKNDDLIKFEEKLDNYLKPRIIKEIQEKLAENGEQLDKETIKNLHNCSFETLDFCSQRI